MAADKVTLVSLKAHRYDGQLWLAGERFRARIQDAALLKKLGRARDVEDADERRTYKRRDMKAEKS
jgi:hypothetical protein